MELFTDFSFLKEYYPLYIEGTITTIVISFFTVIMGSFLGVFLAFMKISKVAPFRWIASTYIEIVRGTPILVQALIVFAITTFPDIYIGESFNLGRALPGILVLSLNSAAYIAEIIRAGISAVDKGQREAAESLGMKNSLIMKFVIMPQAIKNILPAIGNEFVTLIKESSILYVLGVQELMTKSYTVVNATFQPVTPLIVASVLYFMITFTLSKGVSYFERRMNKDARS